MAPGGAAVTQAGREASVPECAAVWRSSNVVAVERSWWYSWRVTRTNGHAKIVMNGPNPRFLDDGEQSVLRGTRDWGGPLALPGDPNER